MGNLCPWCDPNPVQGDNHELLDRVAVLENTNAHLKTQLQEAQSRLEKSRTKGEQIVPVAPSSVVRKPKNVEYSLSADGRALLREVFDRMDKDKDGLVNIRELIICLRKDKETAELLSLPMHPSSGGQQNTLVERFHQMDVDGSKQVDFEEFVDYFGMHHEDFEKFMEKKIETQNAVRRILTLGPTDNQRDLNIMRAFRDLKGDFDYISTDTFPHKSDNPHIASFIKICDKDKNKMITQAEFKGAVVEVTRGLNTYDFNVFLIGIDPRAGLWL